MQRAIPQQRLGVQLRYFIQQRFHYIKLNDDLPLSLASRAGLKSYDRILFFNGINVENETYDQILHRFEMERQRPVQMLVCSPATYEHYKTTQKSFTCDLPTIQHLKPIYATSSNQYTYHHRC